MTGAEHKREAERLLEADPDCQCERTDCEHEYALLQRAQIHATLATVPADHAAGSRLLEEALHLRMHGERAPGGNETWRDWDTRAEAFLRGQPQAGGTR